jgi:glycosyltransferase involved in cell wall biosynthesis
VRVHFVNENIGGHATMHRHLSRALADDPDVEPTFWDVPQDVLLARLAGASWPGLGRLDLDLHLIRARLALGGLVRRHLARLEPRPDVLHFYTQNTALLSVDWMRTIPSVVSIDATNRQNAYRIPHRRPTRFTPVGVAVGHRWELRVFRAARAVVAHSRWAADSVLGYGIPAERIHVVPFGIDIPHIPEPVRDNEKPRIAFVATSMARKGGWRLLRLWQTALRDRATLVLVTPEQVPALDGVEVHGDVRPGDGKLERLLAGADVLVQPGEIDAFGYSILEAMAAWLPVVAVRQAATPELVADGGSGLLVPPGDDAALVAALARLVDRADERRAMGAEGRRRVETSFDARRTTAALLDIVRAVSAAGDGRPR